MTPEQIFDIRPADPNGLFFDATGRIVGSPSELIGANPEPEGAAIFSVLQFGTIIPPLSPWMGVGRLLPGYRYDGTDKKEPLTITGSARKDLNTPQKLAGEVERVLDRVIVKTVGDGPHPIVLFSGGVDSGLIASRLAALGYADTVLMNYSFDKNDPASQLAESMAKHIGLRLERVTSDGLDPCDCLTEPGKVYRQPFTDSSTGLISDLAHSVVSRFEGERRPVLDGSGVGGFATAWRLRRWKYAMSLPRIIKRGAASFYAAWLWYRDVRPELELRVLRRLSQMPELSAMTARNPLSEIFYYYEGADQVLDLLHDWISGWAGSSFSRQMVASSMVASSANVYAHNALPIYEAAGFAMHFPFLDTEMIGLALASADMPDQKHRKGALKLSLARHVPREMVYRPRSGFADPKRRVFRDPKFIEYLRSAVDSTGPISTFLIKENVLKGSDLLHQGEPLPRQTLGCLWAITFLDRWYQTAI